MSPGWKMTDCTRAVDGGAGRSRTGDPLLAKQVLCQLSYDPIRGRENEYIKNELRKIYFVRSTETQKTAGLTLPLPSTMDAKAKA